MEEKQMDYAKVPHEINNIIWDNISLLAQLFPSVVKDGQVDFEALKEELGQFEEVNKEKYELTWAGKQNAKKKAQEDVYNRTLNYIESDSKNPETTENIYIEGDNLEVLKLLRQNYYGAIKMIYIDPPYNTGNDFIYTDNFAMNGKESDIAEGTRDDKGNPLQRNLQSSNRYHANWLNMIYPRLKVAKDLLTNDGVIFISINDIELYNLKKICDEVFGVDNHISTFVWKNKYGPGAFTRGVASLHEYILCYGNNYPDRIDTDLSETEQNKYKLRDNKYLLRGGYITQPLATLSKDDRPNLVYPLIHNGVEIWPNKQWIWSKERLYAAYENDEVVVNEKDGKYSVRFKQYLRDKNGRLRKGTPLSLVTSVFNQDGTKEMDNLIGRGIFDFPKPHALIKHFLSFIIDGNETREDIIMDFFSGSATTAHAVMQLNAEDSGNRKFIMVQLPEETGNSTEAYKAGYKNISVIGKERIRRAGEKIKREIESANAQPKIGEEQKKIPDIGFKVFCTADTNIRWNTNDQVDPAGTKRGFESPDELDFITGAKDTDVVYEVMLRQKDVPLSSTLETLTDIGSRTYLYGSAYLVCLETDITEELIDKLAALDPLPIRFVFRDSAFNDDINLKDETFRRLKNLIERNSGLTKKAYTVEFI